MATPYCLPDDLNLVVQPVQERPTGRRHRRDTRETYEGYPSVVNQSFAFTRPSHPAPAPAPLHQPLVAHPAPRVVPPVPPPLAPISPSALTIPPFRGPAVARTPLMETPAVPSRPPSSVIAVSRPASGLPLDVTATQPTVTEATSDRSVPALDEVTHPPGTAPPVDTAPKEPVMVQTPSRLSHKKTIDVDDWEEDMSCPICMNVMVGPCLLSPCGHALCGPCIVPWLETRATTGESINCLVCRERVSKRHPLVQSRNLEAVIQRWVKHKMAEGNWEGNADWAERQELWAVHKEYNPELLSPELFNRRSPASPSDTGATTDSLTRRLGTSTASDGWPTLFDFPSFSDPRGSHFATTVTFGVPTYDPFQQFTEMHSRFDALRNSILHDVGRHRQ